MSEFEKWLLPEIERNIRNWPDSQKIVIFECGIGWLMGGFGIGCSLIMLIIGTDAISRFVGSSLASIWGIGFLMCGFATTRSYFRALKESNRVGA